MDYRKACIWLSTHSKCKCTGIFLLQFPHVCTDILWYVAHNGDTSLGFSDRNAYHRRYKAIESLQILHTIHRKHKYEILNFHSIFVN
jgi:hypothetical protein